MALEMKKRKGRSHCGTKAEIKYSRGLLNIMCGIHCKAFRTLFLCCIHSRDVYARIVIALGLVSAHVKLGLTALRT